MLKKLLSEQTKGLLSDESIQLIEKAITDKAQLQVEAALAKQDETYSAKLQQLLEAIDKDHTNKLKKVVKAIDGNNAQKLKMVIEKYNKVVNEQAESFKKSMVRNISKFLDITLEQKIPQNLVEEAVKEKKASIVLKQLRESLAVDSSLMKSSIKEALIDGKKQIDEAKQLAEETKKQNKLITEQLARTQASLILEQKTMGVSEKKKAYAKRVLEGKSPKFILENIDYTLSLFDKKEEEHIETLKNEAFDQRTITDENVIVEDTETEEILTEETEELNPLVEHYMGELGKY